ncbi:MAG: hypothetical protein ACFFCD_15135 [Promethearchaeota archaeon]
MFWIEHLLPKFFKHLHFMPEMMGHEEFPELKKEMLELYKKFLETQIKHIDKQLEKAAEEKKEK